MKRLTYKNCVGEYEIRLKKNSKKEWRVFESDECFEINGEPIDKLGELEEVLEKFGIKNADSLNAVLMFFKTITREKF